MSELERRDFLKGCFFAAAGVGLVASKIRASEPVAESTDLPQSAILSDGEATTYLLTFHTGQEVMKGLKAFARRYALTAGHLTGIGAISDAEIGYFDPQQNSYLRTHEAGQAELLSLIGNLALYEGEPFFHVHISLGRRDGSARGGHLFSTTVRPTVKLVLTAYSTQVKRSVDRATGLPLFELSPSSSPGHVTTSHLRRS
jgi:predicted DNA-binding protein with PD1-like motif